jgi:hemerythrin-like metal-binding protein
MQLLAWSDALKTHIDVIDRQHRGLVDMVNATATKLAAESALSAEEVRLLLGYLTDYAEVHFSTEEALMALCGLSPSYTNRHHLNHARFLAHVGDMLENMSEDAVLDGRQLLAFLGDWLIRHIQGEDRGLAQRLHAARLDASPALRAMHPAADAPRGAGPASSFTDAVARGSAALHASEADVLSLVAENAHAALVISLDASLVPAKVLHANAAAAALLGRSAEALRTCSVAALFGAGQSARFPVVMSEVLVSGYFEGLLDCIGPDVRVASVAARITYLVLQGQMVILVVFDSPAGHPRTREPDAPPAAAASTAGAAGASAASLGPGRTVLSRHPLFRNVTEAELASLERASTLVRLYKGQLLFDKGDDPTGLYMVISGQMSLAVSNSRGAEKVLDIVDPQHMFGEVEVFTGCPYRMFARSLASTVLLTIPAATVRRLQTSSRRFAGAAVEHLGRRLLEVKGEVEALTLHTAMERIIDHLLEHASINGLGVLEAMLPAQKQVIASYLNLSPPTLSRAFQQLSDAGLIVVSRRYVTIPDRDRLMRYRAQDAAGQEPGGSKTRSQ